MTPAPSGRDTVGDHVLQRLLPSRSLLAEKQRAENFPVALRILPAALRQDLGALYGVARVIDDLGDESAGDRTAALTAFREDLARAWGGEPEEPVLRALVPVIRRRGLEREPFDRLVRANVQDQVVARYATQAELEQYCELSANPVGRIVLRIFGVRSAEAERLSDLVCTALQLIEHCQDVAEDYGNGRVYLPQEDLDRSGVTEADLGAPRANGAVRRAVALQIGKASDQLAEGRALLGLLRGWARLAIAGYLAGGLATIDALRRAGWDSLSATPRPRKWDVLRHLSTLLLRGGRR
ncbi:MAG TPA: squalene synthase HpnC [Amycolatopsis sp.]|nr:squalene synthase HpnC [Amycolatopsis sp.]